MDVANNETKLTAIVRKLIAQVKLCENPMVYPHQRAELPFEHDPKCQAWVKVTGTTGFLQLPCAILCQCRNDLGMGIGYRGYSTYLIIPGQEILSKSVWDLYDDDLHWDTSGEIHSGPLPEDILTHTHGAKGWGVF